MAWGARLISPTGLFASDNAKAEKNDRPISRHILFMTDGEMNTPREHLSHPRMESSLPHLGATDITHAIHRTNHTFPVLTTVSTELSWSHSLVLLVRRHH